MFHSCSYAPEQDLPYFATTVSSPVPLSQLFFHWTPAWPVFCHFALIYFVADDLTEPNLVDFILLLWFPRPHYGTHPLEYLYSFYFVIQITNENIRIRSRSKPWGSPFGKPSKSKGKEFVILMWTHFFSVKYVLRWFHGDHSSWSAYGNVMWNGVKNPAYFKIHDICFHFLIL